jgi:hypothetical protein
MTLLILLAAVVIVDVAAFYFGVEDRDGFSGKPAIR